MPFAVYQDQTAQCTCLEASSPGYLYRKYTILRESTLLFFLKKELKTERFEWQTIPHEVFGHSFDLYMQLAKAIWLND